MVGVDAHCGAVALFCISFALLAGIQHAEVRPGLGRQGAASDCQLADGVGLAVAFRCCQQHTEIQDGFGALRRQFDGAAQMGFGVGDVAAIEVEVAEIGVGIRMARVDRQRFVECAQGRRLIAILQRADAAQAGCIGSALSRGLSVGGCAAREDVPGIGGHGRGKAALVKKCMAVIPSAAWFLTLSGAPVSPLCCRVVPAISSRRSPLRPRR